MPEFQLPVPNSPVQSLDPAFTQQFNTPKPKRKAGMFAGAQLDLSNAINGYLAGIGSPVGMANLQAHHQQKMREAEAAAQAQQYQQQRADGMTDWVQKQEWQAAHPSPVNNDTVADYQFIANQLGPEEAKNYLRTKTNPVVMTPYGPMPYSAVTGARPEVGAVIDDPRQQGGQTPSASGGFPY